MTVVDLFPDSAHSAEVVLLAALALVLLSQGCFMLYIVRRLNDQWFDREWPADDAMTGYPALLDWPKPKPDSPADPRHGIMG